MIAHNIKIFAMGISIVFLVLCLILCIFFERRLSRKSLFFRYGAMTIMIIGGIIIFLSAIGIVDSYPLVIFAGYLMGISPIFEGYVTKYRKKLLEKGIELETNNRIDQISYRLFLVAGWMFIFILTLVNIVMFFYYYFL